jgi:hypothetical protein
MIEILQIITNILVCIFCLSGWIFFSEASLKLRNEREMFKQAKRIQDILAQMGSHSNEEDKDA